MSVARAGPEEQGCNRPRDPIQQLDELVAWIKAALRVSAGNCLGCGVDQEYGSGDQPQNHAADCELMRLLEVP